MKSDCSFLTGCHTFKSWSIRKHYQRFQKTFSKLFAFFWRCIDGSNRFGLRCGFDVSDYVSWSLCKFGLSSNRDSIYSYFIAAESAGSSEKSSIKDCRSSPHKLQRDPSLFSPHVLWVEGLLPMLAGFRLPQLPVRLNLSAVVDNHNFTPSAAMRCIFLIAFTLSAEGRQPLRRD